MMGEVREGGDRAAGLLLKALDGLPAGERQTVLRALLTGSLGAVAGGRSSLPLDEYFVVPERQPGEFEKLSSVSRMLRFGSRRHRTSGCAGGPRITGSPWRSSSGA